MTSPQPSQPTNLPCTRDLALRFAVLPAALLLVVTCARSYLEIHHPEQANLVSAMTLLIAMNLVWPAIFLAKGATFAQFLKVNLLLIVLVRAPIAAMYALAFAGQWKVEGTGEFVRYIVQFTDGKQGFKLALDTNPAIIFAVSLVFSTLFHLVQTLVAYTLTWAVAFRSKRSFMRPFPNP